MSWRGHLKGPTYARKQLQEAIYRPHPGPYLKRARRAMGWSQKLMASAIGVHRSSYQEWERDNRRISEESKTKIKRLLCSMVSQYSVRKPGEPYL